jgi:hypothetical protein
MNILPSYPIESIWNHHLEMSSTYHDWAWSTTSRRNDVPAQHRDGGVEVPAVRDRKGWAVVHVSGGSKGLENQTRSWAGCIFNGGLMGI